MGRICAINKSIPVVVVSIRTGVFIHEFGEPRRDCHFDIAFTNQMVPVSVEVEIAWERDFRRETESVGLQSVEWKSSSITDHNSSVNDVAVLCLHLVANEFTFSHLTAPGRILILDVDLACIEVLQVSEREHGGVRNNLERHRHEGRRQCCGGRDLQALVLHIRALRSEPLKRNRIEFSCTRIRDVFRLNRHTRFCDVVNLGGVGVTVAGEVTDGTILVSVVIVVHRNVGCEASNCHCIALGVDNAAFDSESVACVVCDGVVVNSC